MLLSCFLYFKRLYFVILILKNMLKKIKRFWNNIKIGLALGMKSADEEILHNDNGGDDVDSGVHQQVSDKRVAKHLLKGEITQEVEELRYRTFAVDREAKGYDFYSPVKAVKKPQTLSRKMMYLTDKGLILITIQPNRHIGDDVYEALAEIDTKNIQVDKKGEIQQNIGKIKKKHRYTIQVERPQDFFPRYRLEEYTQKVVCFYADEEKKKCVVDFYVTKYPNDKDYKSKGFVRELENIRDKKMKSDVVDIKGLEFQTVHAYGKNDGLFYKFQNFVFDGIYEYDGDYIVRYKGSVAVDGEDFFDKYYSESMAKKYRDNAPKEATVNYDPYNTADIRTYKCAICGKTVSYNQQDIDNVVPTDDTDKIEKDNDVTEFMDMENTEQLFGKKICKECMAKHKSELMAEYYESVSKNKAE